MTTQTPLLKLLGASIALTGAALALSPDAHAADYYQGRFLGSWSDASAWTTGQVPDETDNVTFANFSDVVYDSAASGTQEGIYLNGSDFSLERDLTVTTFSLRESTYHDGGNDMTVELLSNGYSNGNSGSLVREGGSLTIEQVILDRAGDWIFAPGDTISVGLTTRTIFGSWVDLYVDQTNTAYSNSGEGLSLDYETGNFVLGSTDAGNQAELTLSWDSAQTGDIDWTLRWLGDHTSELQAYYDQGQLLIGSVPTGQAFDSSKNIFMYDGYTYVGFAADSDGDGVINIEDACPAEDASGYDTDSDGCLDDSDGDGVTDDQDLCPSEDASGYDTDSDGCLDDSDGDGITDDVDSCPSEDASAADGDQDGCLDDRDGDGVTDDLDSCPDQDATGFDADGDGCIDDTDGDGVLDDLDACPEEDASAADADGDGCLDATDDCPETSTGCSTAGDGGSMLLGMLALLGLMFTRRRDQ